MIPVTDYLRRTALQPGGEAAQPNASQPVRVEDAADGERSHGRRYGPSDAVLAAQLPTLCCPNCGALIAGLSGASQRYHPPAAIRTNPAYQMPHDSQDELEYSLDPCGCRISVLWAGAYQREILARRNGGTPSRVVDMTDAERARRSTELAGEIVKLMSDRENPALTLAEREVIDYHLVVATDRLMRLHPGQHNRLRAALVTPLSPVVAAWAGEKNLAPETGSVPLLPVSSPGSYQPNYRMPDIYRRNRERQTAGTASPPLNVPQTVRQPVPIEIRTFERQQRRILRLDEAELETEKNA